MQRTSWQSLVLLALFFGLLTYLVLTGLDGRGLLPVPVPAVTALGPTALAVLLLWLGRGVRRLVRREPTSMTPIGAARVVALAMASALVGAALAGYFGAQLILALEHIQAPLPRDQALAAGLALLATVVLVVVALVVEHWCRVPPDDEDETHHRTGGRPSAA